MSLYADTGFLHVASALVLGAKTFFSFDKRQCALAIAAGLVVPPP